MAKTYEQLQAEIAALQKKAEEVRKKELAGVIDSINAVIAQYGLTPEDLRFASTAAPARRRRAAQPALATRAKKGAAKPKYRDGAGNHWSGRGPRPGWLKDALAQGQSLEDFLA